MNKKAKNVFRWAYLYWIVFSLTLLGIVIELIGSGTSNHEKLFGLTIAISCCWSQIYFLKMNRFRSLTIVKLAKSAFVGVCLGIIPHSLYFVIMQGDLNLWVTFLILAFIITPFYLLVAFIVQKRVLKHIIKA